MNKLKRLTLIVLLALVGVSCGTDGLKVDEEPISFTNTGDLGDADYVQAGSQYSFTINVSEGNAENVNLTTFTSGGNWLKAKVINDGAGIELSGTPSVDDAYTNYEFLVTGLTSTESNAEATFTVYVDGGS